MKILHLLSGGGIGGIEMLCHDIAELSREQPYQLNLNAKLGIEETIKWIRNNLECYKSDLYNL